MIRMLIFAAKYFENLIFLLYQKFFKTLLFLSQESSSKPRQENNDHHRWSDICCWSWWSGKNMWPRTWGIRCCWKNASCFNWDYNGCESKLPSQPNNAKSMTWIVVSCSYFILWPENYAQLTFKILNFKTF